MTMKTNDNGTDRDMTTDELAAYETLKVELAKKASDQAKLASDKATARQAVLNKLGLTADEVAALLS